MKKRQSQEQQTALRIAVPYIRVSTNEQQELSPASQLKKIKEYALAHDFLLSDEYQFIEDEGRSGRSATKRPEFQRMIGLAKSKPRPFDAILVWKFSRFARNREDSVVYKSMLRKQCGIEVVSVSENLGDDKTSVLIEAIIEAMDEYYSINLAGEVLRGMTEKAERGGLVGSAAFGYCVESGQLIPDPEQAETVKLIFESFAGGMGYKAIANMLNDMGLRTRKGKLFENRVVEYILRNPVYIGKTRWSPNGHIDRDFEKEGIILTDGQHPSIISEALFEAAQTRAKEIRNIYQPYQREAHPKCCMLQGLVRCSDCGSTLVKSANGLQCHSYAHGKCKRSHYISTERINNAVMELIAKDFKKGDFSLTVRQLEGATDRAQVVAQQLKRTEEKFERAKDAYEAGIYTLEEYRTSREKIAAEIKRLSELCPPAEPLSPAKAKTQFLKKNRTSLNLLSNPELDDEEKNNLLRSFIEKIVYDRAKDKIIIFYYL